MSRKLRRISAPVVGALPKATSIRTRIKGLSQRDVEVLRNVGEHLGELASADLARRCQLGKAHTTADWSTRKRELTPASSGRWAGSITRVNNEEYALARRNRARHISSLRQAIRTIRKRLAVPVGGKDGKTLGYFTEQEHWYKTQRLAHLKAKLVRKSSEEEAGKVSVCRGGKRLLKNRLYLDEANLTKNEWLVAWQSRRAFLSADGESGKGYGNETIRVSPEGTIDIRLPTPLKHLSNVRGCRYRLDGKAVFSYRADEWLARVEGNKAVAYRIWYSSEKERWYIDAAFSVAQPPAGMPTLEALRDGNKVLGVDLNADHLAAWLMDASGNPTGKPLRIPLELDDLPASTRDGRLRAAISELIAYAAKRGANVMVVENLGFDLADSREKYGRRKAFRKTIHGMPTARFRERLVSMCARSGIAVVGVDPAYTSKWGVEHWKKPLSCDRHEAAALTIGRRGLGHGAKRKVCKTPAPQQQATTLPGMEAVSPKMGMQGREKWRTVSRVAEAARESATPAASRLPPEGRIYCPRGV